MTKDTEEARALVMSILRARAESGDRCPTQRELRGILYVHGLMLHALAEPWQLAKEGLFRLEVWAHNWRVIIYPDGKQTRASPRGAAPYIVMDKAKPEECILPKMQEW